MWPWQGKHWGKVFIERKPNPHGFKILTFCITSAITNRPYLWHMIPDFSKEKVTVADVLNSFKDHLQTHPKVPVTADSWFGMISWLQANPEISFTFALNKSQDAELIPVFTFGLKANQYRYFTNGNVIVTAYATSEKVLINASNYFIPRGKVPPSKQAEDFDFFKKEAMVVT